MARKIAVTVVALGLVAVGWVAAGIAQTTKPDFELIVGAPAGETTIECVRGCNLAWVERGLIPGATPITKFQFACGGIAVGRCSSGRIGGWATP